MHLRTYKILAIITMGTPAIGLVTFLGGMRSVNIGAFVFPLLLSTFFFPQHKKK